MKVSSAVLVVSLVANLVLVGALFVGAQQSGDEGPASTVVAATRKVSSVDATHVWAELRADDLKEQAEKLRADGFPPTMIRAILSAQIRAQFAARRKALEAQGDQAFWKAQDPNSQAALRALTMEEFKLLKTILGPDPINSHGASLRRQFPHFPPEMIDQIAAIQERYDEQRTEMFMRNRTFSMLPDDQAKIEALNKAMRAEMASLMPAALLEEYELRTSNIANQLRHELVAFDVSEQEFRTLYKLKNAFEEQYGYRAGQTDEQMRARMTAQSRLNDEIKAALGDVRFAEYQRATDHQYRQTTQLVARLNLPAETANSLYSIQKEFEQHRNDLYRTSGGPPGSPEFEAMVNQAKALQTQAVARVVPLLRDAKHLEAYKQYGGAWLNSLVPQPPPAPAKKSG